MAEQDREVKPHQEETEVVNLGLSEERKEVKVDTNNYKTKGRMQIIKRGQTTMNLETYMLNL